MHQGSLLNTQSSTISNQINSNSKKEIGQEVDDPIRSNSTQNDSLLSDGFEDIKHDVSSDFKFISFQHLHHQHPRYHQEANHLLDPASPSLKDKACYLTQTWKSRQFESKPWSTIPRTNQSDLLSDGQFSKLIFAEKSLTNNHRTFLVRKSLRRLDICVILIDGKSLFWGGYVLG